MKMDFKTLLHPKFSNVLLIGIVFAVFNYAEEIFLNRACGAAMVLSTFALWIACFIITYTFPLLNQSFGAAGTFWVYAGICVLGFLFVLKKLPETKGKTLEEIESE